MNCADLPSLAGSDTNIPACSGCGSGDRRSERKRRQPWTNQPDCRRQHARAQRGLGWGASPTAFTLIELLVVISIIATLATLTLAGTRIIRVMVSKNTTVNRMEMIKTGLGKLGGSEGVSIAMRLQREGGLDGVMGWSQGTNPVDGSVYATPDLAGWDGGSADNYWTRRHLIDPGAPGRTVTWLNQNDATTHYALLATDDASRELGLRPYLPFPWGVARPSTILDPTKTTTPPPDPFLLRWCSPYRSRELLAAASIIPARNGSAANPAYPEYMTDRSTARAWNDAWGNPLVVAFAMYQPPRNSSTFNQNYATSGSTSQNEDYILIQARNRYRSEREIYISIAAAGPVLPAELRDLQQQAQPNQWHEAAASQDGTWVKSATGGVLHGIWQLATVTSYQHTQPAVDPEPTAYRQDTYHQLTSPIGSLDIWPGEWSEKSWCSPAWQGVRIKDFKHPDGTTYQCFLSAPTTFR